jgi:hypothetical protein
MNSLDPIEAEIEAMREHLFERAASALNAVSLSDAGTS